jgi:hypothetical protein
MSFFKRALNLGKGMVSTLGSDREARLREEALEAELSKPTRVPQRVEKGVKEEAPGTSEAPHPASDPLSRPPVKRTL